MNIAVYPGSFDPVTKGHLDIIKRASKLYDKVIVGVLTNRGKFPFFSTEKRIEFIKKAVADFDNVEVDCFNGLLVDFLKTKKANVIIKGLRATSDFEYEFQMALVNKQMCDDIETIFLTSSVKYTYLSSSVVREIGRYGGDVSAFVPSVILNDIKNGLLLGGKI